MHRHICFWFDTDSQFIFDSFSAHEFGKNNLIRPSEGEKAALNKIYEKLKTASESEDNYMKYALIIEMLSILRKFVGSKTEKVVLPSLLHEILADIDKSFTSMCNLDYLTAKYYISQSTLNRMFRTHLCTTPKIYVETKKLAHSRKLLKEGKSVSFAARESGFNNVSNYIRLFKKRFGITPNEYKQQQRKKSE